MRAFFRFSFFLLLVIIAIGGVKKWRQKKEHIVFSTLDSVELNLTNNISDKKIQEDEIDRIDEFFRISGLKSSVVQTVTFKRHVSWIKGRGAWISDYSRYYQTSKYFIARSLNQKREYFKLDVSQGDKFNVFRPGKDFSFHLYLNRSSHEIFFYLQEEQNEKVLIKKYNVGLGGEKTPIGEYLIGEEVAIYHPQIFGEVDGKRVEMCQHFGSRWMPLLGLNIGIQGVHEKKQHHLGKDLSNGSIILANEDIEELYAILVGHPTTVYIQ